MATLIPKVEVMSNRIKRLIANRKNRQAAARQAAAKRKDCRDTGNGLLVV